VKAVLIPKVCWSVWSRHDFAPDCFCYLHHWREATHPDDHKVEIWRCRWGSQTYYEAYVMAGPYGETQYLRQEFTTAGAARRAAERAVQRALAEGALSL
jgi:hypothetical protein